MLTPTNRPRGDDGLGTRLGRTDEAVDLLGRRIARQARQAATASVVYVQDEAPSSPVKGTLWYDTDAGV
ncbi:hypothetical protein GCM10027053_52080 [Intrasporangium mesophilum]